MASDASDSTKQAESVPAPVIEDAAARSKKQLNILLVGFGFILLSTISTRRAIHRRIRWAKPTYFRQNMHHPEQKFDGGLEAIEALSIATVNVFSWTIFFTGGAMWASNTSSFDEIRSRLRVRLGLSEEEQKDSQVIVGQWIEAAKPWNTFKKDKSKTSNTDATGSEVKIQDEREETGSSSS